MKPIYHTTISLLVILIIAESCNKSSQTLVLQTETVEVKSTDDILLIDSTMVKPILYSHIPSFAELQVAESKAKFIGAVLPAILVAKFRLGKDFDRVKRLKEQENWSEEDSTFYKTQLDRFKAEDLQDLISRLRTHPNSIVLAQAAIESGWGSSRFFQEANNLFGVWSYNQNEPRIPAGVQREDEQVYLRKYDDISKSIVDYFQTVGRSFAYDSFRMERNLTQNVDRLLPHLQYYSERREAYVEDLRTIIRQNDLTQYDDHQIDPAYFISR